MAEQLPVISIVLPMRNAATTLVDCLQSIAKQTFRHYEVVIIDDGSSDGSASIVEGWRQQDQRIRLYRQPPLGLVPALNKGVSLARGQYIARMDADDLMTEHRLQAQLQYLSGHPHVDLVAAQAELFSSAGIKTGYQEYLRWQNNCITHRDITDQIYVESPIVHPTVMVRRDVLTRVGGYRQGDFPEDYELWLRMSATGMRFGKIPQVLLKWRDESNRTSRTDSRYSKESFDKLRAGYLAKDPRIQSSRPFVVCGAGRRTRRRVELLNKTPFCWIDVDSKKIGRFYNGAPVVSYSRLRELAASPRKPFILSYVNNYGARDLISKELIACGFQRGEDYLMVG
jgi:glycosyltransferase involved in cell wall biosynthesis